MGCFFLVRSKFESLAFLSKCFVKTLLKKHHHILFVFELFLGTGEGVSFSVTFAREGGHFLDNDK